MSDSIFVLGGCRSGKSSYALELANQVPGKKVFIATCVPHDDEMQQRVIRHQQERGLNWRAEEVPVNLSEAIPQLSSEADVLLVDCLTLWVSNLLSKTQEEEELFAHVHSLLESIQKCPVQIVLVSNEVGTGIVPENALARIFRDTVGMVNQKVASCVDKVIWTVAGIPVTIK